MRGHQTIIRMRLAGYKPAHVWVFVLQNECPRDYFRDAENVVMNGGQAEVHIGIDDLPGTMDFRFLTGLSVLLQGTDKDRLRGVFARLKDFEPARVIVSGDGVLHQFQQKEAAQ